MGKTNKLEMITSISKRTNISTNEVKYIVNEFITEMKNSLLDNNNIELRGFGTFEIRERKGKENLRNPKTGEKVVSKDHSVVVFRMGQELTDGVYDLNK